MALRADGPGRRSAADLALQARLIREGLLGARAPECSFLPPSLSSRAREGSVLEAERARDRLRAGIPLLHEERVHVDVVYAADLLGGCLGSILAGLFLLPLLGAGATSAVVALLALAAIVTI